MSKGFLHGNGGGAALNFKVVGGTAAPASPSENTIWVNTDTSITIWIFSGTEPDQPEAGMVWISVGTSGAISFNALKKNGITLYPLEAYQYIGGAWVKKTAQIYQNGEWSPWVVYLFNNGDVTELTGGWTTIGGSQGPYSTGIPKNTSTADYLQASTNDSIGFLRHTNLIDLTPYTTVHFDCTVNDNSGYTGTSNCCPIIMPEGSTNAQKALVKQAIPNFGDFEDLQVDITNVNQKAWIGWWFYDWQSMSANGTVTIRKIWLT